MDIGIGIPNSVRGTTGAQIIEWAKRAEAAGFSSLSSIGAVEYPTYEELTTFAACGAVTERIRFFSNVMIAPARSAAELAKQAATVDQLTGGRLTLGLAVGWRQSDFDLAGREFSERGAAFDRMLADLATAWAGQPLAEGTRPVAPPTTSGGEVPIMIGGQSDNAIRRAVEHGIGWTAGGMAPDDVATFGDKVRKAWADAGKAGEPRIACLVYFGLGGVEDRARDYIADYYSPMGDDVVNMIASSVLTSPEAVGGAIAAYRDAGIDELLLNPTVSDPAQVDLLAEVAFG